MKQGLLRFGLAVILLWMVFWTVAYVIQPQTNENTMSPPVLTPRTFIVVGIAAAFMTPWVVLGFRDY